MVPTPPASIDVLTSRRDLAVAHVAPTISADLELAANPLVELILSLAFLSVFAGAIALLILVGKAILRMVKGRRRASTPCRRRSSGSPIPTRSS
jgi:hypothetical protein